MICLSICELCVIFHPDKQTNHQVTDHQTNIIAKIQILESNKQINRLLFYVSWFKIVLKISFVYLMKSMKDMQIVHYQTLHNKTQELTHDSDRLTQERLNCIANALKLHLSCINPLRCLLLVQT